MDELSQDAKRLIQQALSREQVLDVGHRQELWGGIGQRLVDSSAALHGKESGGLGATNALGPLLKVVAAGSAVAVLAFAGSAWLGQSTPETAPHPAPLEAPPPPKEPLNQAPSSLGNAPPPWTEVVSPVANVPPAPAPAEPRARLQKKPQRFVEKSARPAASAPETPANAAAPEAVVLEERPTPRASSRETLRAELALLNQSYALIDAGKPTQALAVLGEHRRKHPNPVLGEEALAARAIAECRLASSADSRRGRVSSFLARAKSSPLAERVRRACQAK